MDPEVAAALEQLRDIHLPAQPGWWPPAPGWWLVAIALVVLLFFLALRLYRKVRARRPVRQFEAELMRLSLQPGNAEQDLQAMSALTRRLAITLYGRERVASLTGETWLELLDEISGGTDFTKGPGRILEYGPYQPVTVDQLQPVRSCLRNLGRSVQVPPGSTGS